MIKQKKIKLFPNKFNFLKKKLILFLSESDLKQKLWINGYFVEDTNGNLNFIKTEKQISFISTGRKNAKMNRSIINAIKLFIYIFINISI